MKIKILSNDDRCGMFRYCFEHNETVPGKVHGSLDTGKNYVVKKYTIMPSDNRLDPWEVTIELIDVLVKDAKYLVEMEYKDFWEHTYPMYSKEDELTLKELGKCIWQEALRQDKIKRGEK